MGDPGGSVAFHAAPDAVSRYRFGLGITDYLLCARCGTYIGAIMEDEGRSIGIVNVNMLDIRDTFDPAPPLQSLARTARRALGPVPRHFLSRSIFGQEPHLFCSA